MYYLLEELKKSREHFSEPSPLITFIIPSIGRPSLQRTINSLMDMKDPDWKAIIVFDGINPTLK